MGQQQSKDELLYQQVNYGNVEGVKALCRHGAGLEWTDREGKTPLIVACMNPGLYNVAKTLIEIGANVNAYRPGCHAGTPLHHAAKRGLEQTVKLLLSHGANALAINDDCQTPLDVARAKGFSNVVRAIENHVCLFSGWLRELHGPGFLEVLAPKLVSKNVWVVIVPCGARKNTKPFKLELAVYSSPQDAQPHRVIPLWRANLEEVNFNQPEPTAAIIDNSTKMRMKFAAASESDKQQFQRFCDACKGIPQVIPPAFAHDSQSSVVPPSAPPATEDLELDTAFNASVQSAGMERQPGSMQHTGFDKCASTSQNNFLVLPTKEQSGHWARDEAGPSGNSGPLAEPSVVSLDSVPSAPPAANETSEDGPFHYPLIDSSPADLIADDENMPASKDVKKEDPSTCVVCLDAPVEGACVPCGHMAGCMSCLNKIKCKEWGCPVCRVKIDQVIKLYAV